MIDVEIKKEGKLVNIRLGGHLTLENSEQIKSKLLEGISKGKEIHIQFGEIEAVDFSFFQLVCSTHRTVESQGKIILMPEVIPAPIHEGAQALGFFRRITCSEARINRCLWYLK